MDSTWHYAVVVGIDEYPGFPNNTKDLKCAIADARAMAGWLESPSGANLNDRVTLMTRMQPAARVPPVPVVPEITGAILATINRFSTDLSAAFPDDEEQKKQAWTKSRFYFYISGHGIDGNGNNPALVAANAQPAALDNISTHSVLNHLKKDRVFAEIVILADCCRELKEGYVQDLPWNLARYRGFNHPDFPRAFVATASRARQLAYEPPAANSEGVKLSFFTHVLLQGLEGAVADALVDSESLRKLLQQKLPDLTKRLVNQEQHPDFIPCDPPIIFSDRLKRFSVRFTAAPNSAFASMAEAEAINFEANAARVRHSLKNLGSGIFEGNLPSGNYLLLPAGAHPMEPDTPYFPFLVMGADYHANLS